MWGIAILADLRPMGVRFHAVVVFGLGKNLLFKSGLGRCAIRVLVPLTPPNFHISHKMDQVRF